MGKVPKVKKRAPSSKSRAARRAASPAPEDLDKPSNVTTEEYKPSSPDRNTTADQDLDLSVLAARHNAGVSKRPKKTKAKPMSRQQRLRKERGMEKADAVIDKLETKVKRSKDKGRKIKNRNAAWEDLNEKIAPIGRKRAKQSGKVEEHGQSMDTAMVDQPVAA